MYKQKKRNATAQLKIFQPGEDAPEPIDDGPDPIDAHALALGIAPDDLSVDEWVDILRSHRPAIYTEPATLDSPKACISREARIRLYAKRRRSKLKLFNPNDLIRKSAAVGEADHLERPALRLRNGAVEEGGARSRDGEYTAAQPPRKKGKQQ